MITTVTKKLLMFILPLSLLLSACGDDNPVDPVDNGDGDEIEIPNVYQNLPGTLITEDETWSNDTTIAGPHFVLPGVTLTVEPGVTVSFEYHNGNSDDVGTIITLDQDDENFSDGTRPSGRLVADGEADNPIVFTSARDNPERNDWGGIILTGHAPNSNPSGVGEVEGLDDAIQYGGNKDDDDSGILRYVRIEYTGFSISEGSELQALTLYSVGSGTTIEYVQTYECSDDGIELFGGTVDIKYFVTYGADDDSYDYDQGWTGRGQFWLAVQKPGADNGFENDGCDDLSDCDGGNGPTSPNLYNVTVYGAGEGSSPEKNNFGLRLREHLEGSYNNFIVANMDGAPFVLEGGDEGEEGDDTYSNYPEVLSLNSFVIYENGDFQDVSGAGGRADQPDAERYADSYEEFDPMFNNSGNYDFSLQADSPALTGGETPPDDGFFDQVEYRGAFGTDDWTREGNWVRWPSQ
jgi:hypothetical protein